ncbi:methyltransferase [Mycobacterium phage LittleE]|uniref:Methyltransferase n=1 Tax=Mycobacterium phage LittleE TaxID=2922212 RepID=G1D3Q2_9CAUD|nr:glycosyltransferase [Mycobacterium phage LittleE]AEK09402.1 methyltransferase [Mycobacterium phage LittleE]
MYQPKWVGGKTVGKGERDAAKRCDAIIAYLSRHGFEDDARVLDLGAYSGYFSHRLADRFGFRVVAADDNPDLHPGRNVQVINRRLTPDEIRALGHFDAVLCLSVLHHQPNWRDYLTALQDVGDHLLIETSHPAEHLPSARAQDQAADIESAVRAIASGIVAYTPGYDHSQRRPLWVVANSDDIVADVVILSRGETVELREMTQATVDTCIAGADPLRVNVTVIEQTDAQYRDATTVFRGDPFNYNRRMNAGARMGTAPWLVFANNDLVFHPGWLGALVGADYPLVSPKEPNDVRQSHITANTVGDVNGTHLSGWCFMMQRALWEHIGGLDECVNFWCSDDVVIQQCARAGVHPMLVTDATVTHKGSVTFNREPDLFDDRTWADMKRYLDKYGKHDLMNSPSYKAWLEK